MSIDRLIEAGVWVVSAGLLIVFVPRHKRREAAIGALMMQLIAWVLGLAAVEFHLLSYPSRFFAVATDASFTFEFCALPAIGAIYIVRYPAASAPWVRWLYALAFPTALSALEWPIVRYTPLVRYEHWNIGVTWISELLVLQAVFLFDKWFQGRPLFRRHGADSRMA